MKKDQLINKLEQAWEAFTESFTGLTDEQMVEPGVTEDWSVKDILAHVTGWEEESLKHIPHILQGIQPPRYSIAYGGIDAFNALKTEEKKGLSISEIRKQLYDTHQKLVDYIKTVPEEQFTSTTRFWRRLRLDTYSHYPVHANAIREWRKRAV